MNKLLISLLLLLDFVWGVGKRSKLINFYRSGIENCETDGMLMLSFDDGIK